MEQDTGSGVDPAAVSSMPDEQPAPQPAEPPSAAFEPTSSVAEPTEQAAPAEPAEPGERDETGEPASEPTRVAGELTATGEPRVDAALRQLRELDALPVSEHAPVYERIHGQLVEVLGELHTGPADPAGR